MDALIGQGNRQDNICYASLRYYIQLSSYWLPVKKSTVIKVKVEILWDRFIDFDQVPIGHILPNKHMRLFIKHTHQAGVLAIVSLSASSLLAAFTY